MHSKKITVSQDGESWDAWLYEPQTSGPWPGIVLLPEIFGLTSAMETQAAYWSAKGFLVAIPDIFWRNERNVRLGYEDADRAKAFSLYQQFDHERAAGDLAQLTKRLRQLSQCTGEAGAVGYCFGGTLAWLMAANGDVDFAIAFYGTRIQDYLDKAPQISCPVNLHFGTVDAHVPRATVERIQEAVSGNPNVSVHLYEGAGHAFMNEDRPTFDRAATTFALAAGLSCARKAFVQGTGIGADR